MIYERNRKDGKIYEHNRGDGKIWFGRQETTTTQDADRRVKKIHDLDQARFDSLLDSFAHFTECQMATLEMIKDRKRTAKCDIVRQQSITDKMLAVLRKQGFDPEGRDQRNKFPRLAEILKEST